MSSNEVKLAPEEVQRVMGIIQQAYSDMEAVAHGIGAHSGNVRAAYQGGGTARAETTYQDLGRAGQALAHALDGLAQDLGLTANTGLETDAAAEGALNRVDTSGIRADLGVAQGI